MASVQEPQYQAEELAHIDMADHIEGFASSVRQVCGIVGVRVAEDVTAVVLDIDPVDSLGLLINELASIPTQKASAPSKEAGPESHGGEIRV